MSQAFPNQAALVTGGFRSIRRDISLTLAQSGIKAAEDYKDQSKNVAVFRLVPGAVSPTTCIRSKALRASG